MHKPKIEENPLLHYPDNYYCYDCATKYDLLEVMGTTYLDKEFFSIYFTTPDYSVKSERIPDSEFLIRYIVTGKKYHVRMNLHDKITEILDSGIFFPSNILTVPGLPINPSNIKTKLKTYLTFM